MRVMAWMVVRMTPTQSLNLVGGADIEPSLCKLWLSTLESAPIEEHCFVTMMFEKIVGKPVLM